MRIFATGATGFLGYHFVNEAVSQGHDVLCLRRSSSKSLFSPSIEERISWVTDNENLQKQVQKYKPDVLFHAAWGGVRDAGREDVDIQHDNLILSRKLFALYPYKQIISIGSQAEYGYYSDRICEDYPLCPTMEYGRAKVACCEELKAFCDSHETEWQWIRIFTVFGEKQTGGLIKMAITKCLDGDTVFDTTEGMQRYSYLYAKDFAKAVCNVLGKQGKSGIFNLSQPSCVYCNKDILTIIKQKTKSNIILNFGAIPYAKNQVMLMDGNVEKFESAFGKIPNTDFDQSLENTIDSFRIQHG